MKQHFLWVSSEPRLSFVPFGDLVLVGCRLQNAISSVQNELQGRVYIALTSHSWGGCGSVSKGSATLSPPELKAVAKFVNQTSFPPRMSQQTQHIHSMGRNRPQPTTLVISFPFMDHNSRLHPISSEPPFHNHQPSPTNCIRPFRPSN